MSQRSSRPVRSVEAAVDRLEKLYADASAVLVAALDRFLTTREPPSREMRAAFRYPLLRVVYKDSERSLPSHRRAFGRLQRPGVYETTVTHPRAFRRYLIEQLTPLIAEYGARIEVAVSDQEIPYPYVMERADALAGGTVSAAELARHFPTPHLAAVGDEIADGQWEYRDGQAAAAVAVRCGPRRLLAAAPRALYRQRMALRAAVDPAHQLSPLRRPVRALGAGAAGFRRHLQPRRAARQRVDRAAAHSPAEADALVAGCAWHRYQMPAYHLVAPEGEGVTLVNIGVGPSNAKNITDHLAVLRPNCWLMVGHCGGLRDTQRIGDYVLAHAYLRQDRILDALMPPEVPLPALAEIQVALQDAAAMVTGASGEALEGLLRTGTVVTNDDRNWELRFTQERKRINLSRAIAVDMESGTIAAQGFRLRVPYGTLAVRLRQAAARRDQAARRRQCLLRARRRATSGNRPQGP